MVRAICSFWLAASLVACASEVPPTTDSGSRLDVGTVDASRGDAMRSDAGLETVPAAERLTRDQAVSLFCDVVVTAARDAAVRCCGDTGRAPSAAECAAGFSSAGIAFFDRRVLLASIEVLSAYYAQCRVDPYYPLSSRRAAYESAVADVDLGATCGEVAAWCADGGARCYDGDLCTTSWDPTRFERAAEGEECFSDGECNDPLVCVESVCTALILDGAGCDGASTCVPGDGCRGGVCVETSDCTPAAGECGFRSGCVGMRGPGTCQPLGGEGARCFLETSGCAPGLICVGDEYEYGRRVGPGRPEGGYCRPPFGPGERCWVEGGDTYFHACEPGYTCDRAGGLGCVALPGPAAIGAPCSFRGCVDGAHCEGDGGAGTCVVNGTGLGATCDPFRAVGCTVGFCAYVPGGVDGICSSPEARVDGSLCGHDLQCASGSCVVGRCVTPGSAGHACEDRAPCGDGLFCGGSTCRPIVVGACNYDEECGESAWCAPTDWHCDDCAF